MLGRYVAGTLLILGAAMVMAPEVPRTQVADVSRARSMPAALPAGQPADMAEAARTETRVSVTTTADIAAPTTDEAAMQNGLENALAAALELDGVEDDVSRVANAPGAIDASEADIREVAALDTPDATGDSIGVWNGLSDPNGATEMTLASTANSGPSPDNDPAV